MFLLAHATQSSLSYTGAQKRGDFHPSCPLPPRWSSGPFLTLPTASHPLLVYSFQEQFLSASSVLLSSHHGLASYSPVYCQYSFNFSVASHRIVSSTLPLILAGPHNLCYYIAFTVRFLSSLGLCLVRLAASFSFTLFAITRYVPYATIPYCYSARCGPPTLALCFLFMPSFGVAALRCAPAPLPLRD